MEKKIRVAQIICQCVNGGVEACIMNYYNNIDRSKFQFDFFVESTSKIIDREKIESMGGKIIIVPPYKKIFKFINFLKQNLKDYDIVHSNINVLSVFSLYAAKKAGCNVRIAHSHSTTNKKEVIKNIVKLFLRVFSKKYATHYFACSKLAGEWMFGKKTVSNGKVFILNNSIDTNKFCFSSENREEIRKKHNIEKNIVIGHIGRFVKQKNHDFLIDVFKNLYEMNKKYRLLLIGDGPKRSLIKNKVEKLGINDAVIFTGNISDTYKYYSAMDVFLLPSLYEGLPVVGVESQMNGLTSFFSNKITTEVIINDNVKMIPIECVVEWVENITNINSYDRCIISEELLEKYNINTQTNNLEKEYLKILIMEE